MSNSRWSTVFQEEKKGRGADPEQTLCKLVKWFPIERPNQPTKFGKLINPVFKIKLHHERDAAEECHSVNMTLKGNLIWHNPPTTGLPAIKDIDGKALKGRYGHTFDDTLAKPVTVQGESYQITRPELEKRLGKELFRECLMLWAGRIARFQKGDIEDFSDEMLEAA